MYHLIGLKTCSTCKAVEKQLKNLGIDYKYQDVRQDQPSLGQIQTWIQAIGSDQVNKLLNSSGNVYKERGLKDVWKTADLDIKTQLLASDGMLLKRPILIAPDQKVYVGKEVNQYLSGLE